jgi:hypothetical protein
LIYELSLTFVEYFLATSDGNTIHTFLSGILRDFTHFIESSSSISFTSFLTFLEKNYQTPIITEGLINKSSLFYLNMRLEYDFAGSFLAWDILVTNLVKECKS